MSADNGIYIAKFPDGFRVCEAQAIENIYYYPEKSVERKRTLKSYFGNSPVFKTKNKALLYASELEDKILSDPKGLGVLEYGVSYIGKYESFIQKKKERRNKWL